MTFMPHVDVFARRVQSDWNVADLPHLRLFAPPGFVQSHKKHLFQRVDKYFRHR